MESRYMGEDSATEEQLAARKNEKNYSNDAEYFAKGDIDEKKYHIVNIKNAQQMTPNAMPSFDKDESTPIGQATNVSKYANTYGSSDLECEEPEEDTSWLWDTTSQKMPFSTAEFKTSFSDDETTSFVNVSDIEDDGSSDAEAKGCTITKGKCAAGAVFFSVGTAVVHYGKQKVFPNENRVLSDKRAEAACNEMSTYINCQGESNCRWDGDVNCKAESPKPKVCKCIHKKTKRQYKTPPPKSEAEIDRMNQEISKKWYATQEKVKECKTKLTVLDGNCNGHGHFETYPESCICDCDDWHTGPYCDKEQRSTGPNAADRIKKNEAYEQFLQEKEKVGAGQKEKQKLAAKDAIVRSSSIYYDVGSQ